jgi:hypothetical protein
MKTAVIILIAASLLPAIAMAATPEACALMTASEASTLAGQPVSLVPNSSGTMCRFHGAGGPGSVGVEIHVKVDADQATAHTEFPRWVTPFPTSAGPTVTAVNKLGDEAAILRNPIMSGVNFRRGAVLVKIGVHPGVDDAALKTAAAAVLGRL